MLDISTITIRNFLSFGDYDVSVKLDDLGPCLITGEVVVESGSDVSELDVSKDSNGAGKSNLINAILWCLFGRTMHNANPGGKVVNFFTEKECVVEIIFKDGNKLNRTRHTNGHVDLSYTTGSGVSLMGTTKMQQNDLNKTLGLDWEIFCGSTFFSQYGQTWMEMSDQRRKNALEREFHMDRLMVYGDVAKEKQQAIELEQRRLQDVVNNKRDTVDRLQSQITELRKASNEFEKAKVIRVQQAEKVLSELISYRDEIVVSDAAALSAKWTIVNQIKEKAAIVENEIQKMADDIRTAEAEIRSRNNKIQQWANRGRACRECEQPISDEYKTAKVSGPESEIVEFNKNIQTITAAIAARKTKLKFITDSISQNKPSKTVNEAINEKKEWEKRNQRIENQKVAIIKIQDEKNHYDSSIGKLDAQIIELESEVKQAAENIKKLDKILAHIMYVYRAYTDRRKIKSHMLKEYIPYLNNRIKHYLDRFKIDLKLEFTEALGIKSDMWGYDFYSGGERKRTDLAMSYAMFDLHALMYGRNCNIIVFDEADDRLDTRGVEVFCEIIKEDFAPKVDTILVVSHRNTLRGTFQSEIRVRREDRFSKISEIIK